MESDALLVSDKLIKKTRRATIACDFCRSKKKKCNGETPCSRCLQSSRICTYSSKKTKRKQLAPVTKGVLKKQENLTTMATTDMYFQLYFQCLNTIGVFYKLDMKSLERPNTKTGLLQYNAILAMSTRAFSSNPKAYKVFENRARQLAGDLFDDFSIETAIGFEMLAFHFWWDSEDKFAYYRRATLSILKQVYESKKENPYVTTRLMVAAAGLGTYIDSTIAKDLLEAFELFNQVDKDDSFVNLIDHTNNIDKTKLLSDKDLLNWTVLRQRLAQHVFKDKNELLKFDKNGISHDDFTEILDLLNTTAEFCKFSPQFELKSALFSKMIHASVYYAAGQKKDSIKEITEFLDTIDRLDVPVNTLCPFSIDIIHYLFRIAYEERDYLLANRISGHQRKIAAVMPSGVAVMEQDMELLKNLSEDSKQDDLFTLPAPSLSVIPQLSISETKQENTFLPGPMDPLFPLLPPEEETFIDQILQCTSPSYFQSIDSIL